MTFVDTNLIMYAVGASHPLRAEARLFFEDALESGEPLCTSAEVLQELLHAYLGVGRIETLDAALTLARARIPVIWPVELEDVELARSLSDRYPGLGARDLLHLASCRRRDVGSVRTFDRGLAAAFA
ncbi:MAG: type II toxin-antitoxin system VapC family toxin [marine benthic group bacterium]|nr:type II toxin-antitoxin system VapC family toxin [Gemmatimonadota bacterium]MCL7962893.1 type II toxin-antitoxin system VapC family toxin [Candidatus Carthagonibacter metallireducens]